MGPYQTLTPLSLVFFLWLILLSPWGNRTLSQSLAQESPSAKLTVRIFGAKNDGGQVAIAVFCSEAGFPGDKSKAVRVLQTTIDPNSRSAQVTLTDLPHGDYAIAVFHDENKNGRLDKNMFGLPKEGYGFSNVLKKSMGAPKFADAEFRVDRPEQNIDIKLLY
jgi:uncharacterized protein (DUF2141 family)